MHTELQIMISQNHFIRRKVPSAIEQVIEVAL